MFKKTDKGVIREYVKERHAVAEQPVTLKLYTGTVAGDPTQGIAKTFTYNYVKGFAVIAAVQQVDVVYSGGIYQLGDIKVLLMRELAPVDDKAQTPGDRLVWKGHEYRQVGNLAPFYLESYVFYNYVFRRI